MDFQPSLLIFAALLLVGARLPGVLIGGTLFTYQLGALSGLPWLGTAYIAAASGIAVCRYALHPHPVRLQSLDFGIAAIVLLSLMSLTWSIDPDSTLDEATALFLSVGGMYGVSRLLPPDDGKSVRSMLWTITAVAPLMSLLLLSQRATSSWTAQRRLLIDGSDATAVGISQPFASCLLACSILLLMRVKSWQKGVALGSLAIVSYGSLASGTRSVFLAYGIGVFAYFGLNFRALKPTLLLQGALALVVASSILLFFFPIDALSQSIDRIVDTGSAVGADASSRERIFFYGAAWSEFLSSPLYGIGDGALLRQIGVSYPHNMILELLAEFGVIGGLVFGFWFLCLVREAAYVRDRDPQTGSILIAFLVVVLVQHQVSFSIAMARTLFLVGALLAAYGGDYRRAALLVAKPRQRANRTGRRRRLFARSRAVSRPVY